MKKLITTLALMFVLAPTAHAGFFGKDEWEKEDCPKNHSLAWCLADYQGRSKGMHDMSREEFAATLKKAGISESNIAGIMHMGLGVGVSMSSFAMGNLLGGGIFLLSAVMPSEADQNKSQQYVVFLSNADQTPKQTAEEMRTAIDKAVTAALATLPKGITVTPVEEGWFKIKSQSSSCDRRFDCLVAYGSNARPYVMVKNEHIPAYLGARTLNSTKRNSSHGISFGHLPKEVNAAALAKAISENLPAKVYWFIPTGYLGGNPMPMFLNQGKALFFVKPSENDPVAVLPHLNSEAKAMNNSVTTTAPNSDRALSEVSKSSGLN